MKIQIGTEYQRLSELTRMCGGELVGADGDIRAVCTDSREAGADTLFVALRGERTDGHAHIPDALARGCTAVLCEERPEVSSALSLIVVKNALEALAAMGAAYLGGFSLVRVAVTGSVGKTTTKEILHSVLSQRFKTYKTEANYNSLIGMPLSALGVSKADRAAVFEMGMSARGEISTMSRVARPDVAMITCIGTSHMEYLGSRENIARAKLEILDGLREGGLLILDGDESLLRTLPEGNYRVLRVCMRDGGDVRADNISCAPELDRMVFDVLLPDGSVWKGLEVPGVGDAVVKDAMYAITAAWSLGLTAQEVRRGLGFYRTVGPRQRQIFLGGVTVLEDCYNAAPESTRAALGALATLAKGRGGRAIAVLGDMRELGRESVARHREIGALAQTRGVCRLMTLGEMGAEIAAGALAAGMPAEDIRVIRATGEGDMEQAARELSAVLRENDVVLIKASRALAAERVTRALSRILTPHAPETP